MLNLFRKRKFSPLFIVQFGGAFNDSFYKGCLALILAYSFSETHDSKILVTFAQLLFVIPFLLFSSFAGNLADKYEKAYLIRYIKIAEIAIVGLICLGLIFQELYSLLALVFILSLQSAFFGPLKYSVLALSLSKEELLPANTLVSSGTFVAILLGTLLGSYLPTLDCGMFIIYIILIVMAGLGFLSSLFIPPLPVTDCSIKLKINVFADVLATFKMMQAKQPEIWKYLFGVAWFWGLVSCVMTQLPVLSSDVLFLEKQSISFFLIIFTVNVILAGILCACLGKKINLIKYLWMYCLGLGMSAAIISYGIYVYRLGELFDNAVSSNKLTFLGQFLSSTEGMIICIGFSFFTIMSVMFFLPTFTKLQVSARTELKARTIAFVNILDNLTMVFAGSGVLFLYAMGGKFMHLMLILSVINFLLFFPFWKIRLAL